MSEGSYWCLKLPTGFSGCLLVSEVAFWHQLVSEDAYWCLSVRTGVCGNLLVSEDTYGCRRVATGV